MESVDRIRYRRDETKASLSMFVDLVDNLGFQAELIRVMYDKTRRTFEEHIKPLRPRYPVIVDQFSELVGYLGYASSRLSNIKKINKLEDEKRKEAENLILQGIAAVGGLHISYETLYQNIKKDGI